MMIIGVAVVILSLSFSGCATLINGKSQIVTINSNVDGATILLNGFVIGETPFTGPIKRSKDTILSIEKNGYKTRTMALLAQYDWIPLILDGLGMVGYGSGSFSTTTDFMTGAVYEYSPNVFYIDLQEDYNYDTGSLEEYWIRRFAMLNHSQIAIEANASNGEYIHALSDLMGSKMDREEAIDTIRIALAASDGYQLAFGDELVKSFRDHN